MINVRAFIDARLAVKPKLSQEKLGKLIGSNQKTISAIENGKIRSTTFFYKIAEVLKVPAHTLDPAIPRGGVDDALRELDPAVAKPLHDSFMQTIQTFKEELPEKS